MGKGNKKHCKSESSISSCSDSGSDSESDCDYNSDACNDKQMEACETIRKCNRTKRHEMEDKYEEYVKSIYKMWKDGVMTEIDITMLKDMKRVFKHMAQKHFEDKSEKLGMLYETMQVFYYIYYWNKHHLCNSKHMEWLSKYDKTFKIWNSTSTVDHVAEYKACVAAILLAETAIDTGLLTETVANLKTARSKLTIFTTNNKMMVDLLNRHEHNKKFECVVDHVEDRLKVIKHEL
jgi:hypothetical protein